MYILYIYYYIYYIKFNQLQIHSFEQVSLQTYLFLQCITITEKG